MSTMFSPPIRTASVNAPAGKPVPAPAAKETGKGFGFRDFLDIVNPLQHIPVVGNIYRNITGDEIGSVARVAGGALFGGIVGAALGGMNAIAVARTGEDLGDIALEKVGLKDKKIDTAGLPVIEVRPAANPAADKNGIIWDEAPQIAVKEKIIWDAPVAVAQAANAPTPDIAPAPAALPAAEKTEAAALPSAQDLNALEPGNPEAFPSPAVLAALQPEKKDVPQSMMQALAKYESMQRLGNAQPQSVVADNGLKTGYKPFSGRGGIRRYN